MHKHPMHLKKSGQNVSENFLKMTQRFKKYHNWGSHIFRTGSRLSDLTTDFFISSNSYVTCDGYVNFQHQGGQRGILADLPVGVSLYVGYRWAPTLAQLPTYPTGARSTPLFGDLHLGRKITWFGGAKDGGNIRDLQQHYLTLNAKACDQLVGNRAYRIEVWAFAHTAVVPFNTRDDLVAVNCDTGQGNEETFGYFSTVIESI